MAPEECAVSLVILKGHEEVSGSAVNAKRKGARVSFSQTRAPLRPLSEEEESSALLAKTVTRA